MLSLADWITTLTFVFGGCCSNAITLERITSGYPHSGTLLTFFQFLAVFLYGLPKQFTFSQPNAIGTSSSRTWFPRLRKRRVPLLPYIVQVALFFTLSTLNNTAFAYDIPMTVHIIFRSGGMIVNMVLGCLLVKKRYPPRQIISVLVVTIGIVLTTLSASKCEAATSGRQSVVASLYAQGIAILSLALLLSGFLGIIQDWENMFFLHSLALPLFYFSKDGIVSELSRMGASPSISLSSIPFGTQAYIPSCVSTVPSIFLHLFANTITQLICVIGVNRLTGRVSSLSVTLILTVRKAVSLLLSVAVYGGQTNAKMWIGAALVFLGTVGYSIGGQPKRATQTKDKKD